MPKTVLHFTFLTAASKLDIMGEERSVTNWCVSRFRLQPSPKGADNSDWKVLATISLTSKMTSCPSDKLIKKRFSFFSIYFVYMKFFKLFLGICRTGKQGQPINRSLSGIVFLHFISSQINSHEGFWLCDDFPYSC